MSFLDGFRQIWLVDFEYRIQEGGLPEPVCLVAKELKSGQTMRLWEDQLKALKLAPFNTSSEALFISYYAPAELGCFLALGWDLPENVLDLYVEFRNVANGFTTPNGSSLLGAMAWYGLDAISTVEKESNRELILRGNYNSEEKARILDYCKEDVIALGKLFNSMKIGDNLIPQSLLRGRYQKAVAKMECNGVPIDVSPFSQLKEHWEELKLALVMQIDKDFGVYEGQTFKLEKFKKYLEKKGILWPALESGQLALGDEIFKDTCRVHPELEPLRQLRFTLSKMRLSEIAVGPDGRNRCMLSPFQAKTGRNQPSNSKFIFGPAVWLRGFIKPEQGHALAYVDWEQQEFGIGAALSRDQAMIKAYRSGDPYIEFAKMANAIPKDATKKSHPKERDLFKSTCLAVQYCMGADSLALRLGITRIEARNLVEMHRRVFEKFWSWSDSAVDYAFLAGKIFTVFGWILHVVDKTKERTVRNYPMQANGAEMLRIACCLATEQGIKVCAPVHDALLIEAPESEIEEVVRATESCMRKASEIVLSGFPLRTEAKIILYPERYMDERGRQMWEKAMGLLEDLERNP